jgi:hypothetical protein
LIEVVVCFFLCDSFRKQGIAQLNSTIDVVLNPCPAPLSSFDLEVGARYIMAGNLFKDGVLEISRCGNVTRWEQMSGALQSFVNS